MSDALRGVVPPVCTPLTPDMDVDVPSLERLVDFLLGAGVHGLFVLGSTSEVAYLPDRHRATVIHTVVSRVAHQVPVVVGAIDTTTLRVLDHVEAARTAGADAVVATAPFYTRTHPAEIHQHFTVIRERGELPLYAYDLPVSVHSKLSHELVVALARDEVLQGVKDSSGDEGGLRKLALANRDLLAPGQFSVLTGAELTVDAELRFGVDGVVPGLGNVDPEGYVRLARHAANGEWDSATDEQERLIKLFEIVRAGDPLRMGGSSSALGAFKAALHLRGIIDHPTTALPQIPLNADEIHTVRNHLVDAGLL